MQNFLIKYYLLLLIVLTVLSCKKDFLDDVNGNYMLSREDYVVDLKTTNEFMMGNYYLAVLVIPDAGTLIYPELISDNIKPITSGATPYSRQYQWNQENDEKALGDFNSVNINGIAYNLYKLIRGCNFAIEKAGEFKNQNVDLASSILSQAYGLRALAHYFLVNNYAQQYNFTPNGSHPGIAYVTSSNITVPVTRRNTVNEDYQMMIADLNQSIKLPIKETKAVYFTKLAAMAMLSKLNLNMGNYGAAKNWAKEVIRVKPLMITDYPAKLFTPNDTEAILHFAPSSGATEEYTTNFPSSYFRTYQYFRATKDIANLLTEDADDKRKVWVTENSGEWEIVKYPEDVVPGPFYYPSMSHYQTIIRSSEMYLIAAESYAQLNQPDSAQYFLDQIRLRANPTTAQTVATGENLMNLIHKERRKEFAFEGFRMFDLLRWKQGVTRVDALPGSPLVLPYPSDKAIAPIPGLDVKSLGLEQNKGY